MEEHWQVMDTVGNGGSCQKDPRLIDRDSDGWWKEMRKERWKKLSVRGRRKKCISRFFGEVKGRQEIIFRRWEQKPLWVIVPKKMRNAANSDVVRSSKKKFFETFCLISYAYIFVFAELWSILVIPAMFLTSVTCRLSDLRKPISAAEPPAERPLRSCKR